MCPGAKCETDGIGSSVAQHRADKIIGFTGTIEAVYNEKLHDWIRKIYERSTYTAGGCTGVWVLGATGLLEGKKATTNWYKAEDI